MFSLIQVLEQLSNTCKSGKPSLARQQFCTWSHQAHEMPQGISLCRQVWAFSSVVSEIPALPNQKQDSKQFFVVQRIKRLMIPGLQMFLQYKEVFVPEPWKELG